MTGRYPALLYLSVGAALLGSFQFGYHAAVTNTSLNFTTDNLGLDFDKQGALVVSVLLVGAIFGALLAGSAADTLGPRTALLANTALFLVGSVLCAWTPGAYPGILAGRFIAGLGVGAASLLVPRYVAEVAPAPIRGALSAQSQVNINLGILLAYALGLPYGKEKAYYLHLFGHSIAWWRVMFMLGVVPAVLQAVALLFVPESPVWLEWKGDAIIALNARRRLQGDGDKDTAPALGDIQEEAAEALLGSEEGGGTGEGASGGWKGLLARRYRLILLLAAALPLLQQASGINTAIYYSSQVFKQAGLHSPVLGSIVMGAVNIGGTLVSAALLDRAGRRQLLLLSHVGMATCLAAVVLLSYLPVAQGLKGLLSCVAIVAFVLAFSLGSGPIPWVYLGEILPDEIKGPAGALCTCLNWVANLLVGLSFPAMLSGLGLGGAYLIYAAFNVGAVVFVALLLVETKQQSLAQIQHRLLLQDRGARSVHTPGAA